MSMLMCGLCGMPLCGMPVQMHDMLVAEKQGRFQ